MESLKELFLKLKEQKSDSKSQAELFDTEKYSKKKVLINDKHKYISNYLIQRNTLRRKY